MQKEVQQENEVLMGTKQEGKGEQGNKPVFNLAGADGLRAIACLAVITHHIMQRLFMAAQPAWAQQAQSFFLLGNTGVSVFFVLSGFLLSYPFWKQYLWDGQFPSIKQYSLRRAARIMPGYYLSLGISVLVLPILLNITSQDFAARFLSGLTFTSGFHYVTFFPSDLNGPLWSISFEVFCYLLMPLFMFGLFKLLGKNRSYFKSLAYWIGVVVFIVIVNQLIHKFLTPNDINKGWEYGIIGGAKYWMPNYNPVGFFGQFAMGILAAGAAAALFNQAGKFEKLKNKGVFDLIGVLCLVGSFMFIWFMRHQPEFSFSLQNQPYYFPFYTLLIAGVLAVTPHSIWFRKILDNRFARFTAKLSFGLYIWHALVMFIVARFWVHNYVPMGEFEGNILGVTDWKVWLATSVVVVIVSYIIAGLSYRFIEKPILDRAHKKKL